MLLKGASYVWKRYISLLTGNLRNSAYSVAHTGEQEAEHALGLFVVVALIFTLLHLGAQEPVTHH